MVDIIISGGGIVGLATAYQIKTLNPDLRVVLMEKETEEAKHQTGHNSGVIHSGIYYRPGSLKAQNCIDGYNSLIEFANQHAIPYEICGKVIVATKTEELSSMDNLYDRGLANGLDGIKKLSINEIKEIEPHVRGVAGIYVPQTGIIDYKLVSKKLMEAFISLGGEVQFANKVLDLKSENSYCRVLSNRGEYQCKLFINCSGLYSDRLARKTHKRLDTRIIPFRGEYFKLKDESKHLVKNLIYPVPDPNFPFLGVHFTRMIDGKIEAGPNAVFAFKREGYKKTDLDMRDLFESLAWPGFRKVMLKYWKTGMGEMYRSISKRAFTKALQQLIPEIEEKDLVPAGAGVRAQACSRFGGLLDDFVIEEQRNFIHVLNAPSPAATSSLSIGKTIAEKALLRFKNVKPNKTVHS